MAEHVNATMQIGQLNLRILGDSAEAGHRVAHGVVHSLAQRIPADMQRRLGALSVRVQVPAGATEAEMSDAVAETIMKALRKGDTGRRMREIKE
ncbi:MAG: hypothetical protein ACREXW_03790 [Gammaproteobacteria bacterium]